MSKRQDAMIRNIISMAVFGTIGVFVRSIPLSSSAVALCRALIAAVLIGGYLAVSGKGIRFGGPARELVLLLVSGAAMGFNWILLFEAYKYTTISIATLSYYFAPVIVTVLCPVLFHEKMTWKKWLCFIMSTLGIVLITGIGDVSAQSSSFKGILFGLGAACLYAAVILLNKFIRGGDGIHRTFWQFVSAAAVLIPYVAWSGGMRPGDMDAKGWICLLVVGVVHTGITYCLYFSSLKELPGQEAAILSYIDPLVAVFISVAVLGEKMTLMQAAGGILILGFTLYNELSQTGENSV